MVSDIRILVLGDSYANFHRFEAGIADAFAVDGRKVTVTSISLPGADSAKLARYLANPERFTMPLTAGPFDAVLLLAGINDITKRRGAGAFLKSMGALVAKARELTPRVFVLEIVHFNEHIDISRAPFRLRNAMFGLLFDHAPGRVARYRDAISALEGVIIVGTTDFMPAHEPARFKDGVHLTDQEFPKLARHVGDQMRANFNI